MNEATVRALIRRFAQAVGITDGDKGDITVSGSGTTWVIDAGAVDTTEIADGAVTFAKLAGAAVVTEGEGIASNDNDTTVPTSAAVKDYVDSAGAGPQLQTAQTATGSNTVFDFTGIPAWVNRITVMGWGLSTNGINLIILRVGDGAIVTSGYLGAAGHVSGTAAATVNGTTSCPIMQANAAADVVRFKCTIDRASGNTWIFSGTAALSNQARAMMFASEVTLSGALDRVRVTTVNGTDTFDVGSVSISWE